MAPIARVRRLAVALTILAAAAPAARADGMFAAVAVSDKASNYGYIASAATREDAEKSALQQCNAPDARVGAWVRDGWCALAVGDENVIGAGSGKTREEARIAALEDASKRTKNVRVFLSISTDGDLIQKYTVPGNGDKHAAIAVVEKAGAWGYSYGLAALEDAKKAAVQRCGAEGAQPVVWVKNGWCALAVGDDNVFGWGSGGSADEANKAALGDAAKRTKNASVILSVSSDGDVVRKKR